MFIPDVRLWTLEEMRSQLCACSNTKEMGTCYYWRRALIWNEDQLCVSSLVPSLACGNYRNKINAMKARGSLLRNEVTCQIDGAFFLPEEDVMKLDIAAYFFLLVSSMVAGAFWYTICDSKGSVS